MKSNSPLNVFGPKKRRKADLRQQANYTERLNKGRRKEEQRWRHNEEDGRG